MREVVVVPLNRLELLQCPVTVISDNSLYLTTQEQLDNLTSPLTSTTKWMFVSAPHNNT